MKNQFNVFMFKYILGEDLADHLKANGALDVRFEPTANVPDPEKFFSKLTTPDKDDYAMFGEEVIRVEAVFPAGRDILYMFFRNGRENRPDLGANRYAFTRLSGIEFGPATNGAYQQTYKMHYADYFPGQPGLAMGTLEETKEAIKRMECDLINEIVKYFNCFFGTSIPKKSPKPIPSAKVTISAPQQNLVVGLAPGMAIADSVGDGWLKIDNQVCSIAAKL